MNFMKSALLFIALLFSANSLGKTLVLKLETFKDHRVVSEISLYTDSESVSAPHPRGSYSIEVDGQALPLNHELLKEIGAKRRGISYDAQTGGIVEPAENPITCAMAGPALGQILSTLYDTREEGKLISQEMKRVYSNMQNCVFAKYLYYPESRSAHVRASRLAAMLHTIQMMVK